MINGNTRRESFPESPENILKTDDFEDRSKDITRSHSRGLIHVKSRGLIRPGGPIGVFSQFQIPEKFFVRMSLSGQNTFRWPRAYRGEAFKCSRLKSMSHRRGGAIAGTGRAAGFAVEFLESVGFTR